MVLKQRPTMEQLSFFPPRCGQVIAGVDEAGRGCLAGPVVAAAVILPAAYELPGLADSKQVSRPVRYELERSIKSQSAAWALGVAWPREIDQTNILAASLAAMHRSVALLKHVPELILVDGNQPIPALTVSQRTVVSGDTLVPAISAASILAKTFRDRLMEHLEKRYPGYGFAVNKGYGTEEHLHALKQLGPCAQHRKSFKRVRIDPKEERQWLPGI